MKGVDADRMVWYSMRYLPPYEMVIYFSQAVLVKRLVTF